MSGQATWGVMTVTKNVFCFDLILLLFLKYFITCVIVFVIISVVFFFFHILLYCLYAYTLPLCTCTHTRIENPQNTLKQCVRNNNNENQNKLKKKNKIPRRG